MAACPWSDTNGLQRHSWPFDESTHDRQDDAYSILMRLVKPERAMLESNPPRNSPETHPDDERGR